MFYKNSAAYGAVKTVESRLVVVIACLSLFVGCSSSSSTTTSLVSPDPPAGLVQIFRTLESGETISEGVVLKKIGGRAFIYAFPVSNESSRTRSATSDTVTSQISIVVGAGTDEHKYVPAKMYFASELIGLPGDILVAEANEVPDQVAFSEGHGLTEGVMLGLTKIKNRIVENERSYEPIREDLEIKTLLDFGRSVTIAVGRQPDAYHGGGIVYDNSGGLIGYLSSSKGGQTYVNVETKYFDEIRGLIEDSMEGRIHDEGFRVVSYDGEYLVGTVSCVSWSFGDQPARVAFEYRPKANLTTKELIVEMKKIKGAGNPNESGLQRWSAEIRISVSNEELKRNNSSISWGFHVDQSEYATSRGQVRLNMELVEGQ